MFWRYIWYDSRIGRLRSGWRVALYLLVFVPLLVYLEQFLLIGAGGDQAELAKMPRHLNMLIEALAIISASLGASIWALQALERLPATTLCLTGGWRAMRDTLSGLGVGVALILLLLLAWVAVGLCTLHGQPPPGQAVMLLPIVGLMLLNALSMTLLFQGYLFQTLLRGSGPLTALAVSAGLYALYFGLNDHTVTILAFVNLFLLGLACGMLFLRTRSLWWPTGFIAGWNLCEFLFRLPGSERGLASPLPLAARVTANLWLTGGAFGPEGGLVASGLLGATLVVLTLPRVGLPLQSGWWNWHEFARVNLPLPWDFTINGRQYQWKLPARDSAEN